MGVREVNMHEAKTHLSRLVQEVEAGAEVVISRAGTPVARLVPWTGRARTIGLRKGQVTTRVDFDDPLPDDLQSAFEGGEDRGAGAR